jgi:hypothetical protein
MQYLFSKEFEKAIQGGSALHRTGTARTVRVRKKYETRYVIRITVDLFCYYSLVKTS